MRSWFPFGVAVTAIACSSERPIFGKSQSSDGHDSQDAAADAGASQDTNDAGSTVDASTTEADNSSNHGNESSGNFVDPSSTLDGAVVPVPDESDVGSPSGDQAGTDEPTAIDGGEVLRVESITPADETVSVPLEAAVEIVFSDVPPQSVVDQIKLSHDGLDVAATVTVSGTKVTVTPNQPMALAVQYQVDISSAETGVELAGDLRTTFNTRDGEWGAVINIDQGSGISSSPCTAMLPDGTAIVLWAHADSGVSSIYSAMRRPGTNWEEPVLVDEAIDGDADMPQVVASSTGHVYAAWHRYEGDRDYVRVAVLADGQWSTPETVSSNATCTKSPDYSTTCNARDPKLAINSVGVTIVGWSEMGQTYVLPANLTTRRLTAQGAWGEPVIIGASDASDDLVLDLDTAGNAIGSKVYRGELGFYRLDGRSGDVWEWLDADLTFDQSRPRGGSQIKFDGRGDAHAVWAIGTGMQAAKYSEQTGWGEVALIGEGVNSAAVDDGATVAVVAASQNNSVLVAWLSPELADGGVSGNRFTGQKWEEPRYLAPPINEGQASSIALDIDSQGNGVLMWTQGTASTGDVWWNRYAFGTWQTGAKLDTGGLVADSAGLAVNATGRAVASWRQGDAITSSIYARVFD